MWSGPLPTFGPQRVIYGPPVYYQQPVYQPAPPVISAPPEVPADVQVYPHGVHVPDPSEGVAATHEAYRKLGIPIRAQGMVVTIPGLGTFLTNEFGAVDVNKPIKPNLGPENKTAKTPSNAAAKMCPNPNCICGGGLDCKCKPTCKCEGGNCDPPTKNAAATTVEDDDKILNFGIDQKKRRENAGRTRYTTNGGKEISKQESSDLLTGDGSLPDDSAFDSLTIIGTKDECDRVKNDVASNPAFSGLKDKLLVQAYRPDDAMVKDKGFVSGSPSIYLQDSKGKVKMRCDTYPGPEFTAGEINKTRPDYDPSKDPQPNKPGPTPVGPNIDIVGLLKSVPAWVWVLGGMFLFMRQPAPQPVKA